MQQVRKTTHVILDPHASPGEVKIARDEGRRAIDNEEAASAELRRLSDELRYVTELYRAQRRPVEALKQRLDAAMDALPPGVLTSAAGRSVIDQILRAAAKRARDAKLPTLGSASDPRALRPSPAGSIGGPGSRSSCANSCRHSVSQRALREVECEYPEWCYCYLPPADPDDAPTYGPQPPPPPNQGKAKPKGAPPPGSEVRQDGPPPVGPGVPPEKPTNDGAPPPRGKSTSTQTPPGVAPPPPVPLPKPEDPVTPSNSVPPKPKKMRKKSTPTRPPPVDPPPPPKDPCAELRRSEWYESVARRRHTVLYGAGELGTYVAGLKVGLLAGGARKDRVASAIAALTSKVNAHPGSAAVGKMNHVFGELGGPEPDPRKRPTAKWCEGKGLRALMDLERALDDFEQYLETLAKMVAIYGLIEGNLETDILTAAGFGGLAKVIHSQDTFRLIMDMSREFIKGVERGERALGLEYRIRTQYLYRLRALHQDHGFDAKIASVVDLAFAAIGGLSGVGRTLKLIRARRAARAGSPTGGRGSRPKPPVFDPPPPPPPPKPPVRRPPRPSPTRPSPQPRQVRPEGTRAHRTVETPRPRKDAPPRTPAGGPEPPPKPAAPVGPGARSGKRSPPPSRFRTPSARRSREAALAAADKAASKGVKRGAAAGLDTGSGTFSGLSNKAGGGRIHPEVQRALDDIPPSLRSDFHAGCAEPRAISEALYAGADLRGSVMTTVLAGGRRHGVLKPACPSCKRLLEHFGIVDGAR